MEHVRIGVVGAGRMGQRHCRIYANLRHAELAGICDLDRQAGEAAARQYDVPFYEQLDDLLEHVEAVSLVVPTPAHCDLALRCLERGIHVLIEKPIAETLEQAERLARAAEASGRVMLIGHLERFNPAYMELRNVLEQMSTLAVNFRRLSPYEGSNQDVDVVLDLMIHDTNLVLDLMGREPAAISAHGLVVFSGFIDHALAQLSFDHGPLVTVTASRVTEQKIRTIDVTAKEAYLECDLLNKHILAHRQTIGEYLMHNHPGTKYRQESIVERIQVPIFEPLFLELQHFVDCILRGRRPLVSARDGLAALRLAMDIREAIRAQWEKTGAAPAPRAQAEAALAPAAR
jgi:predicted dehydrogenase